VSDCALGSGGEGREEREREEREREERGLTLAALRIAASVAILLTVCSVRSRE
jgi:hypothetical protein